MDDIEVLESLECGDDIELKRALENAIKSLKERQSDKERIKELEEENKIIKGNYYILCADIQMVTSELGFTEDTIISEEMVSMIKENYIPVSLVEETIEELKENGYWNYLEERDLETTIGILQELLEKRK